jgi:hemin uptake protein HemP
MIIIRIYNSNCFTLFKFMTDSTSISTSNALDRAIALDTHGLQPVRSQQPVSSAQLLQGRKAVAIAHNGMLYTLQATKLGKLILTK